MRNAYKKALKMEELVLDHLRSVIDHDIATVKQEVRIPGVGEVDFLVKDRQGKQYFVEVKAERVTGLDVGRLASFSAFLSKKEPSAKLFLLCRKVDPVHKDALNKLGVNVIELKGKELVEALQKESVKVAKTLELSPMEQDSYFLLLRKGIWVVTAEKLSEQLDIPKTYSKNILANLARKGVLARFGKGKYVVISPDVVYQRKGYIADPIMILDQLMDNEPYYVAYQSASYIHGIAHQLPFVTNVAVMKQRRSLKVGNSVIKFVTVKKRIMFAFHEQKYLDSYVKVSDLEKTILDCVHRHDVCGGIDEVTRSVSEALPKINIEKLLSYLKRFRNNALAQRLGFILEKLKSAGFNVDPTLIQSIERLRGRHLYPLDFTQAKKGRRSQKWNIIENVDCLGWRHA